MHMAEKGAYGYTDTHKRQQLIKTILFFSLPLAIFIIGYVTTKTNANYFTVVAVVGSLPACKELVNVILFWKRRSLPEELYRELASHTEGMETAYELVLTTYEKTYSIHCVVISGNQVIGYATQRNMDVKKAQEYIASVLKQNGYPAHVHIFMDLKQFLDRVDTLAQREPEAPSFTPDDRYPDFTREQIIRQVILAVSV